MANLSRWNITIEYGPTSSDSYDFAVAASSAKDALAKAKQWAKDHNISSPMFSEPYEDTYDEILEWTPEEEEEFVNMVGEFTGFDEGQ